MSRYGSFIAAVMATAARNFSFVTGSTIRPAMIEQVALPVFLEHGAEHPAVAVKIGELGVPGLRVQIGQIRQEFGIGPQPAAGRFVGIRHLRPGRTCSAVGCFCWAGYIKSPSVSSSHQ